MINNAGIVSDAPFEDMTADRFEPLLDVHLRGAFHVTRPAWKAMREQGYGRILNTYFGGRNPGRPGMSNYGSAKTGLIGFTRVLAAEGGRPRTSRSMPSPRSPIRECWRTLSTAPARPDDPAAQAVLDDLVEPIPAETGPGAGGSGGGLPDATGIARFPGRSTPLAPGHVSRFFIGRTKGFYSPTLSIEDVRDHLDAIRDEAGYTVPGGPADEMAELFAMIMAN